jgi:hypothetical protein
VGAEDQRSADDSAQNEDHAGGCQKRSDPQERHARNGQHNHAHKDERQSARPMFPAGPPLPGSVESPQPPEDERAAEDEPRWLVALDEHATGEREPHYKAAEQHKDDFNH